MIRWGIRLLIAVPVAFVLLLVAAQLFGGETVVLHTRDANGGVYSTSLWVVDAGAQPYLRAGDPKSTWLLRIGDDPNVEVERRGHRLPYRAVVETPLRDRVDREMALKYGWADSVIAVVRGSTPSTPIRLDPR